MTPTYIVEEISASGQEIGDVVEQLNEVLQGVPRAHAIMGCVAMALALQNPSLTGEQLPDLIMDVSRYLCLVLAGTDEIDGPKN